MKQLHALAADGFLAPIDVELGSLLARRAAGTLADIADVRLVGLAGALLSAERARGHSCLDLEAIAGRTHGGDRVGIQLPDLATCRAVLLRSGLCDGGDAISPLVLDGDRLYLHRFHAAERRLAQAIASRLSAGTTPVPPDPATTATFRACFDVGPDRPTDWQAVAAAAALRSSFTVITGGPGTGKTHTVARVLACLLAREPGLRIAVAAPTGKAAARLADALRAGAAALPIDPALRSRLVLEGVTLHRLLGYQPWDDRFSRDPSHPLAEDVVVVDEASMADLLMMDALFAALRPSARIVLLGDQDQLASVDTGYVLGDVCRAADRSGAVHGSAFAAWYETLAGQRLDSIDIGTPLRDCVVRLRHSHRFAAQKGIGALADAVRAGDAGGALAALASEDHADATRADPLRRPGDVCESLAPLLASYLAAPTPEEALHQLGRFRVLCALRDGRCGVAGVNDAIERWLRDRGMISRATWYDGRPVLITANDPASGLFNGDLGVTWRTADGRQLVFFPAAGGRTRAFATSRIPAHATAWAMTVHKAQGSEWDEVLLMLPDDDHRVLTRELLYTGVTRARRQVTVVGAPDIIRAGVARTVVRASGLSARLDRGHAGP